MNDLEHFFVLSNPRNRSCKANFWLFTVSLCKQSKNLLTLQLFLWYSGITISVYAIMPVKILVKEEIIYLRKFKQVQRKEVTYDLAEWKQIEERAASVMLKTGTFIKRMSLEGKIYYFNMRDVSEVMKALRIIGANINQIAKKANETVDLSMMCQ